MTRAELRVAAVVALALLALCHALLQPAPLSALTGVAAGLALMLFRPRPDLGRVIGAVVIGVAVGAVPHLATHLRGGSPAPVEGLPRHLAIDALLGLGLALAILAAAVGLIGLKRYARSR